MVFILDFKLMKLENTRIIEIVVTALKTKNSRIFANRSRFIVLGSLLLRYFVKLSYLFINMLFYTELATLYSST